MPNQRKVKMMIIIYFRHFYGRWFFGWEEDGKTRRPRLLTSTFSHCQCVQFPANHFYFLLQFIIQKRWKLVSRLARWYKVNWAIVENRSSWSRINRVWLRYQMFQWLARATWRASCHRNDQLAFLLRLGSSIFATNLGTPWERHALWEHFFSMTLSSLQLCQCKNKFTKFKHIISLRSGLILSFDVFVFFSFPGLAVEDQVAYFFVPFRDEKWQTSFLLSFYSRSILRVDKHLIIFKWVLIRKSFS